MYVCMRRVNPTHTQYTYTRGLASTGTKRKVRILLVCFRLACPLCASKTSLEVLCTPK